MYNRNAEGKAMGRLFSRNWHPLRLNADVDDWNGGVWIGTNRALTSTYHLVPSRCRTGLYIVSRETRF